ncbi:cell wall-binding repeat-containing protein [Microbacterium sp. NPDC056569]|uniref:cell wall-binding repeat-containing protein n=1 Tax=Microbacterium sp. NPDC056569 TaxID=3345867 RepID=UPI0036720813
MPLKRLAALVSLSLVFVGLVPVAAQAVEPAPVANGSISGTVTVLSQRESSPAQGYVQLFRWPADGQPYYIANSAFTNGAYAFDGLRPGDYALIFSSDIAGGARWWSGTGPADTPARVTVTADAAVVVDAQLVAPVQVLASIEYRARAADTPRRFDEQIVDAYRLDEQTGRFEFSSAIHVKSVVDPQPHGGLEPGTYRFAAHSSSVQVDGKWYDMARRFFDDTAFLGEARTVAIQPGDVVDLGSLVLEPWGFRETRLAGPDRFSTSVEVSRAVIPDGHRAPVVYLANGYRFPDALAAGPAAARQGGVVLLTDPEVLPDVVAAELRRLDPQRVVVLGRADAVSEAVVDRIGDALPSATAVERIAGVDRFETAELLVRDAFPGAEQAFVVSGLKFPDALAAGAAAASVDAPVLLVQGDGGLDARTSGLIADLGVSRVVVAGDAATVSTAMEAGLVQQLGRADVVRHGGANRFETAFEINMASFYEPDHVLVASGLGFPDGLSAIALAGAYDAPLYLSTPTCVPSSARVGTWRTTVGEVTLIGGPTSVAVVNTSAPLC